MQEANPTMPSEAPPRDGAAAPPGSAIGESAVPGPTIDPALTDAKALQILTTEHWSLLGTRSLAYTRRSAARACSCRSSRRP